MRSEWKEVYLGDVVDKITVGYVGSMTKEYINEGVPFLRSLNVEPFNIKTEEIKYVSSAFHEKIKKSRLQPGDVVIVRTGRPGSCAVIPDWLEEANCSDLVIIRPGKQVDPDFLAAYINTLATDHIYSHLVGAVQQHFNVESARKIKVRLPSIDDQKSIGKVIKNFNEKIHFNRQIISTLEELAQTLFKYWFIDFNFPNEKGEPYRSSGGKMVESELGSIPDGWKLDTLGELTSTIIDHRGKTPKKLGSDWSEVGIPAISAKNIKNNRFINKEKIKYVDQDLYGKWMKTELQEGDFLLTSEAPLGEVYYLPTNERYCLSQRLYGIRANPNIIAPEILYMFFRTDLIQEDMLSRATGSTVLGIRQSELRKVNILVPDKITQNNFVNILKSKFNLIHSLEKENEKLKLFKSTLLPKLLSGEIELNEVINDVPV